MLYSDLKKMIAVCEMLRKGTMQGQLNDFTEMVTRHTTEIMRVKACSIKLLDMTRQNLRFAATYGLSEDYASKGAISIEKSGVNRQVIEGAPYSIGHIDDVKSLQYPEDVRKEGILSMVCFPLRVNARPFGVFCVYSDRSHYFTESDIGFFALMTDLIALTIDSINRKKAHNWFLHKSAHQLRSPLAAIESMLKVLSQGYLGELNQNQAQNVARCLKRLGIMQGSIDDLLKLASERQEVGPPQLVPVEADKILGGLELLYRTQAENKGLTLVMDISKNLPAVYAQPKMIDELFSNLISNAIKYTPPGGRVTVRLSRPSADSIEFEVMDTGVGILEADLPSLFTEFFRAQNARAMTEEGTGLGLSIVKEILDRIGGTIRVKSQEGQGSHFCCSLPIRLPAPPSGDV